ncbi:MAG: helix-turn-helix transcriptional regulator [Clostridia bacterium]|nr:helix-turn-helix transcriptional regulator [Clostridia bacterium]
MHFVDAKGILSQHNGMKNHQFDKPRFTPRLFVFRNEMLLDNTSIFCYTGNKDNWRGDMIGENIKNFRTERNMTQEALAEQLNVTRQAISKWENNNGEPDLDMLHEIAVALHVTVEELLYGKSEVHILSVSQETLPAVCLIGKRYNGNESIRGKWDQWQENDWFSVLEGLGNRQGNYFVGAKRIVNGMLEYWIGMFFLPGTKAPEGFDRIDIAQVNVASFFMQGKAYKLTSFETHNLCLKELPRNGMIRFEDHWCFECFDTKKVPAVFTEKSIAIEYKIAVL